MSAGGRNIRARACPGWKPSPHTTSAGDDLRPHASPSLEKIAPPTRRGLMPSREIDRTTLPIHDAPRPVPEVFDAKDPKAVFPPIEPLAPPDGAPNVLIVLLDDVGF